ncbi:zinc-dependent alcohol dehydrogenase family protein [Amycolatopsis jiangsuensis]|uniref:NADPH:quinone reductase-like Zn-dependent oxidoreductase n=1 Tax=Amycolatopsis jiangsuensis TaxID=1181879 RepID=A0A840IYW7_9PSEU|nr:zinc-dependent alcohol dehydrogenase family protein [Amycolatopsis jiangsuensis]MBB4686338.1 NADPH:quinone reductase-like Zn-dependent oxidoreductase [Amycolatopsis jiangsuensis]
MRVITFDQPGGPEVLHVTETDPAEPGPGEVRLRVEYLGINRPDALFRAGLYPVRPTLPWSRLGIEAVGVVDAIGAGVTGFAPGDRVVAGPIAQQSRHGVYGELAIVPAAEVVPAFDGVSAETTAAVWMAYFTAFGGLVETGGLRAGDHVVVTAATGGVGLAALDVANQAGAVAIAVTRSAGKRDRLLAAGAAHVVVTSDEDLEAEVRKVTGGRGAEVVFDSVGGPRFPDTAAAAADNGTVVAYGWYGAEPAALPTRWPVKILGHNGFAYSTDPAALSRIREHLARGLAAGAFRPRIDRVFEGLDQVTDAHRYLDSGHQVGKVLIKLGN